jgi:threonine/homoserine/homoserine lactone efflux protein
MFNSSLLFPLILFCIVGFFTPGPNNIMLMTNGLNFGMKRSLPAMLGVAFGFSFLVLCVALGLGAVFTAYPVLYIFLKYASGIYMLYLAYMIAKSAPAEPNASKHKKPTSFFQAAALQWINPKGWAMAVTITATYAGVASYPANAFIYAALCIATGLCSGTTWAGLGRFLKRYMHKPRILRTFNVIMALLLVASLYPIFADALK